MVELYCYKCRMLREVKDARVEKTPKAYALKGMCKVCGSSLSQFISNERAVEFGLDNIQPQNEEIKNTDEKRPPTKDELKKWEKENEPKLNKLGFFKRNPILTILKCITLIMVCLLIGFFLYGVTYYPDTISEAIGIKCEVNNSQICDCPQNPCTNQCGNCELSCGNITLKPEINVYTNISE